MSGVFISVYKRCKVLVIFPVVLVRFCNTWICFCLAVLYKINVVKMNWYLLYEYSLDGKATSKALTA